MGKVGFGNRQDHVGDYLAPAMTPVYTKIRVDSSSIQPIKENNNYLIAYLEHYHPTWLLLHIPCLKIYSISTDRY